MTKSRTSFVFLVAAFTLASCGGGPGPEEKNIPVTRTEDLSVYPAFNEDSAFAFVAKQVGFGPRVPNTAAHRACGDWLTEKLNTYCDTVYVQETTVRAWDGSLLKLRNIIGSFRPDDKKRSFYASHWDSRPYADQDDEPASHSQPIDGANDGASGVGVVLELARILSGNPPARGIDIILFDGEDYGEPQGEETGSYEFWALGSTYWAGQPHRPGYTAQYGILLDMVGVPEPRFLMEGTSMYYAPDVMERVWNIAHEAGYARYFPMEEASAIIDDHLPVNEILGIPTIDIIHLEKGRSSNFFEHWHTTEDNLDNVDPKSLGIVGDVMVRMAYSTH